MKQVAILLGLLFLCCIHPTLAQTVPTPESVLGHKPGDDFYLASYDDSREYFRRLAASSNRIKLITVGKTTRGLDWEIALISSPENLAKLDRYKEISRRLADGRGLSDQEARTLARAFVDDRHPGAIYKFIFNAIYNSVLPRPTPTAKPEARPNATPTSG